MTRRSAAKTFRQNRAEQQQRLGIPSETSQTATDQAWHMGKATFASIVASKTSSKPAACGSAAMKMLCEQPTSTAATSAEAFPALGSPKTLSTKSGKSSTPKAAKTPSIVHMAQEPRQANQGGSWASIAAKRMSSKPSNPTKKDQAASQKPNVAHVGETHATDNSSSKAKSVKPLESVKPVESVKPAGSSGKSEALVPYSTNQSKPSHKNKNKTKTKTPGKTTLLSLPTEILEMILGHVLKTEEPISVTATFSPIPDREDKQNNQSKVNFDVLHSCSRLYCIGLPLYYNLNTFAIDVAPFERFADTMEQWPHGIGFSLAARNIRRVICMDHITHNREDWIKLLRGFSGLEEVMFDMRSNMLMGSNWSTKRKEDDERKTVIASETVISTLIKSGIQVGKDVLTNGKTSSCVKMAINAKDKEAECMTSLEDKLDRGWTLAVVKPVELPDYDNIQWDGSNASSYSYVSSDY